MHCTCLLVLLLAWLATSSKLSRNPGGRHPEKHFAAIGPDGLLDDTFDIGEIPHKKKPTKGNVGNAHTSLLGLVLSTDMGKILGRSTAGMQGILNSTVSAMGLQEHAEFGETEEHAEAGNNITQLASSRRDYRRIALITLASLAGVVVVVYVILRIIAVSVKYYLESSVFPELFGVDIHINRLKILPFSFAIGIDRLILDNPKGYATKYLLMVKDLKCSIAPFTFLFTGCTTLHIMKLSIQQVLVNVECSGDFYGGSNVHDIVNYLYYGKVDVHADDEMLPASGRIYYCHTTEINGIRPTVTWRPRILCCHTDSCGGSALQMDVSVPDIFYEDLMTDMGGGTAHTVAAVMTFLVQVVLKKVLKAKQALTPSSAVGDALKGCICGGAKRDDEKRSKLSSAAVPAEESEEEDSKTWFPIPSLLRPLAYPVADVSVRVVQFSKQAVMDSTKAVMEFEVGV